MPLAADIYERLVDEEDARACRDIPEAACRETPRSFVLLLGAQLLTKLGDALTSPKTVLAWIMGGVGAPVALTSLLILVTFVGEAVREAFDPKKFTFYR